MDLLQVASLASHPESHRIQGCDSISLFIYLFIYLFMIGFCIPPTCTNTWELSVGRFASLVLRPPIRFLAVPQIVRLLSNAQSAAYLPSHRCKLRCIMQSQIVAIVQRLANTACLAV